MSSFILHEPPNIMSQLKTSCYYFLWIPHTEAQPLLFIRLWRRFVVTRGQEKKKASDIQGSPTRSSQCCLSVLAQRAGFAKRSSPCSCSALSLTFRHVSLPRCPEVPTSRERRGTPGTKVSSACLHWQCAASPPFTARCLLKGNLNRGWAVRV